MKSFLYVIIFFIILIFSCKSSSIDDIVVPIPEDLEPKMGILDSMDIECELYFFIADEIPAFIGCENHSEEQSRRECTNEALTDFIVKNIKLSKTQYIEEFANKCIGSDCPLVIEFLVDAKGIVHKPTIYWERPNQASDFIKERLIQVISCLPNFKPAILDEEIICFIFRYSLKETDFKD